MKLLLDENLSRRLIPQLLTVFPGSSQIALLELCQASDKQIWEYAKENDFAIVTLDADFHEYSFLSAGKPLVIWLRCGNQPNSVILKKLLDNQDVINAAEIDIDTLCLEIY